MPPKQMKAPPLEPASAFGIDKLCGIDDLGNSPTPHEIQAAYIVRRARVSIHVAREVAALHFGRTVS